MLTNLTLMIAVACTSLQTTAQEHYDRAGTLYDQKEWDKAFAEYDQAIRLNDKSVSAYHNRGIAYLEQEKWDKAIADFEQALLLDPENEEVGDLIEEARQKRKN